LKPITRSTVVTWRKRQSLRVAVDDEPGLLQAFAERARHRPVALDLAGRHGQAAPRQQADRLVVERRRVQRCLHPGKQVGAVRMRLQHLGVLVAEAELDHPVLPALVAAARGERGAHRRVLGRRHRRQHVPGVNELLHDLAHPGEHLEGAVQLVGRDRGDRRLELVQEQLHPQLAHLVLDDEQHLVVRARAALLRPEHLVEVEVVAVTHVAAEIGLGSGGVVGRRPRLRVGHQVTAARCANRGSRQVSRESTSASTPAASQASTKRV
jgi:hypothetical protein